MKFLYIGIMGFFFSFISIKILSKYFGSVERPLTTSSPVVNSVEEELVTPENTKLQAKPETKKPNTSSSLTKTSRAAAPASQVNPTTTVTPTTTGLGNTQKYTQSSLQIQALQEKFATLNSSELKTELQSILKGSVPINIRDEAVRALSKEWAKKSPTEAMEYLAENPIKPTSLNYKAEQEVLRELARTNPEEAVNLLADIDEAGDNRNLFFSDYMSSLAAGWAQSDPDAAFNWLNEQDFKDGTRAFNKYTNELYKIDEDLAIDQINRLSPEKQAEAIKGISAEWGKNENWDAVQNRIEALPQDIQDEAFRNALIPFSKENPSDAMDLITAIPENNTEKNIIVYQVLAQLGQENHRDKMEWAIQNSTTNYTSHVGGTVLRPWIADNPHNAMQWLEQQPAGSATTQLINSYLSNPAAPENYKQVLRDKLTSSQQ